MNQSWETLHHERTRITTDFLNTINSIKFMQRYIKDRFYKNRFYVASKSTEGSKWILIDDICLFVSEFGEVKAFKSIISTETDTTSSINLEHKDVGTALDQLEEKIEKSGWKEGWFLRVSRDTLIRLSTIKEWGQADKDRMILYLWGGDECETVVFQKNKRNRKDQNSVRVRDGLILSQPKTEKYKKNQAIIKKKVQKRS